MANGQFAHDKWVNGNLLAVKAARQANILAAQMINPDRSIDQNQRQRRRGIGRS
jgi:hypothetical protein